LLARSVNSRRKITHRQLLPLAVATGPTGPGVRFPLFLLLDAAPGRMTSYRRTNRTRRSG